MSGNQVHSGRLSPMAPDDGLHQALGDERGPQSHKAHPKAGAWLWDEGPPTGLPASLVARAVGGPSPFLVGSLQQVLRQHQPAPHPLPWIQSRGAGQTQEPTLNPHLFLGLP